MSESRRTLTREEEADRDLRHTEIAPAASRWLVVCLIAVLFLVPLVQVGVDIRDNLAVPVAKRTRIRPYVLDIFRLGFPPQKAQIAAFEKTLEDKSWVSDTFLPPTQNLLTRFAGVGNTQVLPGGDDWLYFREDVEHLTGPGFLRDRSRGKGIFATLTQMRDRFRARGIELLVVPIPSKAAMYPERLAVWPGVNRSPFGGGTDAQPAVPLTNSSYAAFVERLRADGFHVWDGGREFNAWKAEASARREIDLWLHTDTHWHPSVIPKVAESIAQSIQSDKLLDRPMGEPNLYRRQSGKGSIQGDMVRLLKLHERSRLFPDEPIAFDSVLEIATGKICQPRPDSEVLLIGDSYSEYLSGVGTSLLEQLAFALQSPVDRLVVQDVGVSGAWKKLREREMTTGVDPLRGKRLVVLQFAVRRLTHDLWQSDAEGSDRHGL